MCIEKTVSLTFVLDERTTLIKTTIKTTSVKIKLDAESRKYASMAFLGRF